MMNWEIDEEPCDIFCDCDKCIERREYKNREDKKRQYRKSLSDFGFDEYEDIPLLESDKKFYTWKGTYNRKKILGIVCITDKAILFKFNGYRAWFPKSTLFGFPYSKNYLTERYYLNKMAKGKTIEYKKEFNITKIYEEEYNWR